MAVPASEFPLLEEYDLVLTETTGDGKPRDQDPAKPCPLCPSPRRRAWKFH